MSLPMANLNRVAFTQAAPTSSALKLTPFTPTRLMLQMANVGAVTVYLGRDSGVTTATGYPLLAGERVRIRAMAQEIWGITASGTGDIRSFEMHADEGSDLPGLLDFTGASVITLNPTVAAGTELKYTGQTGNTVAGNVANQSVGTTAIGALTNGAANAGTITISDTQITAASVIFLTIKRGTTTPAAGALGTVLASLRAAGTGSVVVDVVNLGTAATLSTDYVLHYLVIN